MSPSHYGLVSAGDTGSLPGCDTIIDLLQVDASLYIM
jgi:hypothetical protein